MRLICSFPVTAILLILLAGGGLSALLYQAWLRPDRRVANALRSAERSLIAHAQPGVRKLEGKARQRDALLTAPISGRRCLAYVLIVEEGRALVGWVPLLRELKAVSFLLQDGTGTAVIEPGEAFELALANTEEGASGGRRPHAPLVEHLRRIGLATESRLGFAKRLRFEEGALSPDGWVTVGGVLGFEPAPEGERKGYRLPPQVLVMRGHADFPLLLSDEPEARAQRLLAGGPRAPAALPGKSAD